MAAQGAKFAATSAPGILEACKDGGELLTDLGCCCSWRLVKLQGSLLWVRHVVVVLAIVKGLKV